MLEEEEGSFVMLELERCEEAIFKLFERERDITWFDYENVDMQKLFGYKTFLWSVVKVYNAMLSKCK